MTNTIVQLSLTTDEAAFLADCIREASAEWFGDTAFREMRAASLIERLNALAKPDAAPNKQPARLE